MKQSSFVQWIWFVVLVFLVTRVLHFLQFHIPSHGPIQKFIFEKMTGTDTLKHCQSLGPRILWDSLNDYFKYEGYPKNT